MGADPAPLQAPLMSPNDSPPEPRRPRAEEIFTEEQLSRDARAYTGPTYTVDEVLEYARQAAERADRDRLGGAAEGSQA